MIRSERFKQARELRGLTQEELADKLGVDQSTIARIEAGQSDASDSIVRAAAFQTGFPIAHFQQEDPPEFTSGSLLFRSRTTLTARERRIAFRYGQLAFELAEKLGRRLKLPPLKLPRMDEPPKQAARMMRMALGIPGDARVDKLVNILERHGVLVLASPVRGVAHDAYSLWAGNDRERAVIIIASGSPGDRLRFSVAHELRHLSCTARGTRGEIERDADVFGAEFLLPEEAMRNVLVPPITLTGLARLKPYWGVAIQTLIRRAVDLEIINPRQYAYLMQQVGMRGWRTKEPVEIPAERPRGLRKMAELLYGKPIDMARLATDVKLSTALVRQILDLHAGGPAVEEQKRGTPGKLLSIERDRESG